MWNGAFCEYCNGKRCTVCRKKALTDETCKFVSYAQSRLNFFREQLAAANRRLDWSIRHNPDWYDHSEKGEVVSFYEWAVKMAEKEVENNGP